MLPQQKIYFLKTIYIAVILKNIMAVQDGLIIIVTTIDNEKREIASKPDVISRGFVYVREAEQLIEGIKQVSTEAVETSLARHNVAWSMMKNNIKSSVAKYIYDRTKRNPMILPIIEEI